MEIETQTETAPAAPEAPQLSEAEAVLRHDPFGAREPEVPAASDTEVDSGADGGKVLEAPAAPAEPVPTAPTADPAIAELLARQTQLLEATLAPKAEPEAPAPAEPRFAVQLPDGLVAMLNSDEPADRAQAINNIVNGVANMTFMAVEQLLQTKLTEFQSSLPTTITQHTEAATTQREAQAVFYGAFPKLADPAIRATVGAVAQEVGKKWMTEGKPFTGMTPEFAEAVATGIAEKFGIPVDAFRAAPAAAPTPAPTAKVVPFAAPAAARQTPAPTLDATLAKLGLDF